MIQTLSESFLMEYNSYKHFHTITKLTWPYSFPRHGLKAKMKIIAKMEFNIFNVCSLKIKSKTFLHKIKGLLSI